MLIIIIIIIILKKNSPFKFKSINNNGYHQGYKNEVKKNNYVNNNSKNIYGYETKKQKTDYKSIGDRLSKIQSLIHQANAK